MDLTDLLDPTQKENLLLFFQGKSIATHRDEDEDEGEPIGVTRYYFKLNDDYYRCTYINRYHTEVECWGKELTYQQKNTILKAFLNYSEKVCFQKYFERGTTFHFKTPLYEQVRVHYDGVDIFVEHDNSYPQIWGLDSVVGLLVECHHYLGTLPEIKN